MLTDHEAEYLRLIATPMSMKEIAAEMRINACHLPHIAESIREKLAVPPDRDLRDVHSRDVVKMATEDFEVAALDSAPAWLRRAALLWARQQLMESGEHLGTIANTAVLLAQLAKMQEKRR